MLGHNWQQNYASIGAAEADLTGFKYKGDGWYHEEQDTLLVMVGEGTGTCTVYCWNGSVEISPPDRRAIINAMLDQIKLANLPDRKIRKNK